MAQRPQCSEFSKSAFFPQGPQDWARVPPPSSAAGSTMPWWVLREVPVGAGGVEQQGRWGWTDPSGA